MHVPQNSPTTLKAYNNLFFPFNMYLRPKFSTATLSVFCHYQKYTQSYLATILEKYIVADYGGSPPTMTSLRREECPTWLTPVTYSMAFNCDMVADSQYHR
jgi:hypothetical protein